MIKSRLMAFEQSPLVKLFIGAVFLVTAFAVLLDLNDRQVQTEIAAWDLFEKTKTGTPQRTRAINLLADTGVSLEKVEFGTKSNNRDWELWLQDLQLFENSVTARFFVTDEIRKIYCENSTGELDGVDFSRRVGWTAAYPWFKAIHINLSETNFDCLHMEGRFISATMDRASLVLTKIIYSDFDGASLSGTRFGGSVIRATKFGNAMLRGASFDFATLSDVDFSQSFLLNANFEGADIQRVDFTGSRLDGANFSNAFIRGETKLTQSQMDLTWAWKDRPPFGLQRFDPPLVVGFLCDPPPQYYSGGALEQEKPPLRESPQDVKRRCTPNSKANLVR